MGSLARTLLAAVLLIGLCACQSQSTRANKLGAQSAGQGSAFVQVQGTAFIRNGQPYYFAGANLWYGAYLGASPTERGRLVAELDRLRGIGITNLRVLAASEQTASSKAVTPALQTAPGEFNEDLLRGLDVLLDEMAKRDMVAVLYLNNFWQWSGGMAQYMSWLRDEQALHPDDTGDWGASTENSATFYRSEKAQSWYRDYIAAVVTRINSINGREYVDDPTIMAWQLANAPRPGSDEAGAEHFEAYEDWIVSTTGFIKSLDPNHLVSTGSEGAMGSLQDIELYRQAHEDSGVDYLTFHMWPKNWGWFDATRAQETYDRTLVTAKAYVLQHLQIAQALEMPITLEEFGLQRDGADYAPGSATVQRDRFFADLYEFIEQQAKLGQPIAGSNFWAWGGMGRAQHSDLVWRAGDSYTGDPPQEPQGLNSVFDGDTSTLQVLRKHAEFMNAL